MIRPTNLLFVAVFILVAISPPTYGNQNVIAMIGNTNAAADNIGPPPAMNCGNFTSVLEPNFAMGSCDKIMANKAQQDQTIARESKNAFAMVETIAVAKSENSSDLMAFTSALQVRAAPKNRITVFNSLSEIST